MDACEVQLDDDMIRRTFHCRNAYVLQYSLVTEKKSTQKDIGQCQFEDTEMP
jgi:hypothetical protein